MGGTMISLNVPNVVSILIIGLIGFAALAIFMQLYLRYVGEGLPGFLNAAR